MFWFDNGHGVGQAETEADFLLGGDEPVAGSRRHPFYSRLNEILDRAKFDTYADRLCRKSLASKLAV